jgi:Flp pilus assembly pilin Flp
MLTRLRRHARTRRASTVEYGLLAAAIVAVVLLVAFAFGSYLHSALRAPCAQSDVLGRQQSTSCRTTDQAR